MAARAPHQKRPLTRGRKRYEGSNHLGNVLVVVSDRKLPLHSGSTVTGYQADVHAHSDYYPFGMTMEERTGSAEGYRFGFQGQETDDEVYGAENAVSYKYRVHDPRLGRFLSIDPLAPEYPWNSPYAFSENRVVDMIELEGLETYPATVDLTTGSQTTAVDNTSMAPVFTPVSGEEQSSEATFLNPPSTSPISPPPSTAPSPPSIEINPLKIAKPAGIFAALMLDPLEAGRGSDLQSKKGTILLAYDPDLGPSGHIIIGISYQEGGTLGDVQWYHQRSNGQEDHPSYFEALDFSEATEIVLNADLVLKKFDYQQVAAATQMASAKTLEPAKPYKVRTNNCSTNCADVLKGAGIPVPRWRDKHPAQLIKWFKSLPDTP